MVAKTYQDLEIVESPYEKDSRMYVKVRTKKGALKEVRWYTAREYAKMYGLPDPGMDFDAKRGLGFHKGYIHIFTHDMENDEYFRKSIARYAIHLGWYVVSNDELPTDLPAGVKAIKLSWELVSENDKIFAYDKVKMIVDKIRKENE